MKKLIAAAVPLLVLIAAAGMLSSYEKPKQSAWNRIKNPETVQMLKHFVAVKKGTGLCFNQCSAVGNSGHV